jgi:hypothetical protein
MSSLRPLTCCNGSEVAPDDSGAFAATADTPDSQPGLSGAFDVAICTPSAHSPRFLDPKALQWKAQERQKEEETNFFKTSSNGDDVRENLKSLQGAQDHILSILVAWTPCMERLDRMADAYLSATTGATQSYSSSSTATNHHTKDATLHDTSDEHPSSTGKKTTFQDSILAVSNGTFEAPLQQKKLQIHILRQTKEQNLKTESPQTKLKKIRSPSSR